MHHYSRRAFVAAAPLAIAAPALGQSPPLYRDRRASVDERVRDLLSRMTLEEKVAQMSCLWVGKSALLDGDGRFSAQRARQPLANGIGQIGRPSDWMGAARWANERFRSAADAIQLVNDIQRHLIENTRLGIPALFHEEAAHGFMADGATIFPTPTALASTWDTALVERVYTVAAREARLRGATVALSPVLDLLREPRFGRTDEFFSEDPWLTAEMGVAAVRGLQGRQRPLAGDRVFATLKHFIHGSPEGGLNIAPADMSERSLRATYLVPFAHAIRSADPAIIMPSYNEVQGVPAHASSDLLQRLGREHLGFTGLYFSDYRAIGHLVSQHRVAATLDEAAIASVNAGIDAELPDAAAFASLPRLVSAGIVDVARIDASAARVLRLKFEAGLFENPYVDAQRAARQTNTAADRALARESATKAIILLKNDGVLPLDARAAFKLAVIGPNARAALFGGYSGVNAQAVGVLQGVQAAAGTQVTVRYAEGVHITAPHGPDDPHLMPLKAANAEANRQLIAAAAALARESDVVLLVVGDNDAVAREALAIQRPGSNAPVRILGDRSTLNLYGDQDLLVEALLDTGKPLVALLLNGRPLAVTRLAERANALLEGWYLGQEGGHAVADVLFGNANPSGKLSVSLPRSVGELPAYYNRQPSADVFDYLEGPRSALFPFGHGLSYTRFSLSAPRLIRDRIGRDEDFSVEVAVENSGPRSGDEVVQLYIRDEVSSAPRPVLELKAFQRVSLAAGKRRTVRFDLPSDTLAFWNIDMRWVVEPGTFTIAVGNSSAALQSATLTVA